MACVDYRLLRTSALDSVVRGSRPMIQKKLSHFALLVLIVAAILHPISAGAQTSSAIVVDRVRTSLTITPQPVLPTSHFGHVIGQGDVEVFYIVYDQPGYCPPSPKAITPTDIVAIELDEDGVAVRRIAYDCLQTSSLSYFPTVPGHKTLTIVAIRRDGVREVSGVHVDMFGVALNTALGQAATTPYLPLTSQIFVGADALLQDANVKEAQFFHRSLPFQLSAGVPYTSGDKVISRGKLFGVLHLISYPPGSSPPVLDGDPTQTTGDPTNYRYIGPQLVADLDYYNYLEAPPSSNTVLPQHYPAPPQNRSDLVISRNTTTGNDDVYQVITAGRLDPNVPVPSLSPSGATATATATGVVLFTFAGGPLQPNLEYFRGQLVVSNGRIYEVVQEGTTSSNVSLGFQQTTGEIAVNGTAGFNFIPSKILKAQLPYWVGDLVVSNGNAYRVTIAGTVTTVGDGLHSISSGLPEPKPGVVTFQKIGGPFNPANAYNPPSPSYGGDVFSADGRIYKVVAPDPTAPGSASPSATDPYQLQNVTVANGTITVQLVVPQFHKYTDINADYAGVPLQEGKVYSAGDIVVSNGSLYKVISGGAMGPVGLGLIGTATQSLGGLVFEYIGPFYKQLSTIHPFADAPFPYSSFDYSFPYSLKWSPAETITNPNSWFGPAGNFEAHTDVELVARTTDSKDRTNISFTLPISILPRIDARAALNVAITDPSPDRVVAAGTPLQITAEVRDQNGVVRLVNSVQFFVDGVPLYAPDVSFPYTTEGPVHWTPTVAGTYILNALAIDDKGNYTMSPDVRVNVTDNQPFVRITTPSSGDPLNPLIVGFGSAITIQGVVSGSGGDPSHIKKIELFSDGNAIGTATANGGQFSFTFAPTNAAYAALNFQITARVTDVNGTTATSNTVYIQVLPAGASTPTPTPGATATATPTPNPTATVSPPLVSPVGYLYETDFSTGNVFQFTTTASGTVLKVKFASGFDGVRALAFDHQGNLFIGDNDSITRITPNGTRTIFASNIHGPNSLTVNRSGDLFVTDRDGNVLRYTPQGVGSVYASGLNKPTGLAFDVSDNLFVAEFGDNAVTKITPAGTKSTFALNMKGPQGVAFDRNGILYVVNGTNGTIEAFTPNGSRFLRVVNLASPVGIAFDSNNNLFVADNCNGAGTNSIIKFTASSETGTTYASGLGCPMQLAFEPPRDPLLNISTRARVEPFLNRELIAGFIVTGTSAKTVLIRALGPSLSAWGVADPLRDPVLELHTPGGTIVNDNWKDAQQSEIASTGVAPSDDRECAMLVTLEPGTYTAVVRGQAPSVAGTAVVEVYDGNLSANANLANISSRGYVQTGDDRMMAGFIVAGGNGAGKIVIRGLGPSLADAGTANVLPNPALSLRDGNGNQIASNNDWTDSQAAELVTTGIPPNNGLESAMVVTLPSGTYTAILSDEDGKSGVGLIEVYNLR